MTAAMSAPIAKSTTPPPTSHPVDLRAAPRGERRSERTPMTAFRSALGKGPTHPTHPTPRASMLGDLAVRPQRRELEGEPKVTRRDPMDQDEEELGTRDASSEDVLETSSIEPHVAEMDLAPFRVNPALQPIRSATPDPVQRDQTASLVASELVESMRVGRFGRDGHAVSMRVRTPTGVIGVELREEAGSLRMALEGASDVELGALSERVRRALSERGIELDVS